MHSECRCIIADSAFASYKLAVALLQRGLYLIGNVKTAHSGFPKLKLQAMADVRGKTATATTIVCLSGSNQEHVILATSDRDKQPVDSARLPGHVWSYPCELTPGHEVLYEEA
mmetsp:Transcript_39265/g.111160  ORF Transcript_39265/g.111160 Transcript_39265/m.111160 type:complete len:113 (+) Transcript_39265:55-393(+)